MLRNNSDLNTIISNVPDEFYEYVKKTISDLKNKYAEIELNARNDIVTIKSKLNDVNDKKEFALEAVKYNNCGLIFAINNGKEYTDTIWKMVRPKWSKPFKIVSEE
jgi:RNA ligase